MLKNLLELLNNNSYSEDMKIAMIIASQQLSLIKVLTNLEEAVRSDNNKFDQFIENNLKTNIFFSIIK